MCKIVSKGPTLEYGRKWEPYFAFVCVNSKLLTAKLAYALGYDVTTTRPFPTNPSAYLTKKRHLTCRTDWAMKEGEREGGGGLPTRHEVGRVVVPDVYRFTIGGINLIQLQFVAKKPPSSFLFHEK